MEVGRFWEQSPSIQREKGIVGVELGRSGKKFNLGHLGVANHLYIKNQVCLLSLFVPGVSVFVNSAKQMEKTQSTIEDKRKNIRVTFYDFNYNFVAFRFFIFISDLDYLRFHF